VKIFIDGCPKGRSQGRGKMNIRISPQYLMQYQDKPKEKPQPHYAHDGGRFDEVFERKVGEIGNEKMWIESEK